MFTHPDPLLATVALGLLAVVIVMVVVLEWPARRKR